MNRLYQPYVEAKGNRCPFCGSIELRHSDDPEMQGDGIVWWRVWCKCEKGWTDVYELKDMILESEGGAWRE